MPNFENSLITPEDEIRHIPNRDWNPLWLKYDAATQGHYEPYVEPILEILKSTRSKKALIDLLHAAKTGDFGLIDFPRHRNRMTARKLLQIEIPGDAGISL